MNQFKLLKLAGYLVLVYFMVFYFWVAAKDGSGPNSRRQFQIQMLPVFHRSEIKINVMDIGAKADGVTDDTAIIQKAVTQAKNGTVFFPKGTYRVSDTILVKESGLTMAGDNATLLFKKGASSPYNLRQIQGGKVFEKEIPVSAILVKGNLNSSGFPVTDDIMKDSLTIKAPTKQANFAVGDTIVVTSKSFGKEIYRQKAKLSFHRELNFMTDVVEVQPGQIKLQSPVPLTLLRKQNLRIFRVSPVRNVTIKGLIIVFEDNTSMEDVSGITLAYAVNSSIKNVTVNKTSSAGIDMFHCYLSEISECQIADSTTFDSAHGLGISLNRSHYCIIRNNILDNHRHGIILDRGNSNCLIEGNKVTNCKTTASIDLHGENNSYNVVRANIITGGKTGIVIGGGGEVHYNDGPFNCIVDNKISNCNTGIEIKNETESIVLGNNQFDETVKREILLTNVKSSQIIRID